MDDRVSTPTRPNPARHCHTMARPHCMNGSNLLQPVCVPVPVPILSEIPHICNSRWRGTVPYHMGCRVFFSTSGLAGHRCQHRGVGKCRSCLSVLPKTRPVSNPRSASSAYLDLHIWETSSCSSAQPVMIVSNPTKPLVATLRFLIDLCCVR